MRAQEYSTEKLEHAGEDDSLLDGEGLGSDGGSEGVSYIIGTDTEGSEQGTEGTDDDDPQKGIRRLGGQNTLVVHGAAGFVSVGRVGT